MVHADVCATLHIDASVHPIESVADQLETVFCLPAVVPRGVNAVVQAFEAVAVKPVGSGIRVVHPNSTAYSGNIRIHADETVALHFVPRAVVQLKPADIAAVTGGGEQVEGVPGHRDELVAVDAHPRGVVLELRLVHRHRELVAGGVHLDGRGEAGEHAFSRIIMALAVNGGQVGGASGPHFHARVLGIKEGTLGLLKQCSLL